MAINRPSRENRKFQEVIDYFNKKLLEKGIKSIRRKGFTEVCFPPGCIYVFNYSVPCQKNGISITLKTLYDLSRFPVLNEKTVDRIDNVESYRIIMQDLLGTGEKLKATGELRVDEEIRNSFEVNFESDRITKVYIHYNSDLVRHYRNRLEQLVSGSIVKKAIEIAFEMYNYKPKKL